ncbi:MAG TPA: hypothetical protein VGL91_00075 [Acidobacteriota bacterium]
MRNLTAVALILSIVTGVSLRAYSPTIEQKEAIRKSFDLSRSSSARRVEVDNVHGSIHVTGYNGREVELVANRTVRADTSEKAQQALQEVQLDISQHDNTVRLYVDGPFRCHCPDGSFGDRRWQEPGYKVSFDFDLKVPVDSSLFLRTINDGDIKVENVAGDYDIKNINGGIEMNEISGSGQVYALNGRVKVLFRENPRSPSSFGSLNGNVDLYFLPDLSADLRFKTFNGQVYSDFPVTYVPIVNSPGERQNGKFVYKSNRFSSARVGRGGPEIKLDGFNGDIRVLQRER